MILITTALNQLSGTIPDIGQLTGLTSLYLGKYEGCSRSFHALFCIYKTHIFCPPFFLNNRSQLTNKTIVIHRHITHFV
jgi:hypothetical protein